MLWQKSYCSLFNQFTSHSNTIHDPVNQSDDYVPPVTVAEVKSAIKKLKFGSSSGIDGISHNHVKFCSNIFFQVLSLLFTVMLSHCFIPLDIIKNVIVPIIKNKLGNSNDLDNYRGIALGTTFSKIIENILINRLDKFIKTVDWQFGFKNDHSTVDAAFVLKNTIDKYTNNGSYVYVCFLNARKAFDRVHHQTLFDILKRRSVPTYILNFLHFWYSKQVSCVRWGSAFSNWFSVSNGVRQGGCLSPFLFNVYIDDLLNAVQKVNVGCIINGVRINCIEYADDIVLIAPSQKGLQQLIDFISSEASLLKIDFNVNKSAIMIFSPVNKVHRIPRYDVKFYLNGMILQIVNDLNTLVP